MNASLRISPYLIISTLVFLYSIQRISYVSIAATSISPADIFLLFSVIFFSMRLNFYHMIISLLFFLFFTLIALINNIYAINSIITLTLKIYLTLRLTFLFEKTAPTKLDLKITYLYFFTLFMILIVFSENNPFFNFTLMNPNEGINYLIVLWFLINIFHIQGSRFSSFKLRYNHLLPSFLILSIAVFMYTRQGILSLVLFFFLYLVMNKNIKPIQKILYMTPFIFLIISLVVFIQSLGDYETQRIQTILTLDPSTRSDQKRIDLINFGIHGFLDYPYGHGLGSFIANNKFDRIAHSFYIATMYQLGIVGLITAGYIIFKALTNFFKSRHFRNSLLLSTNLIVLIFFFQILFIGALGKIGIFVISAWVLSHHKYMDDLKNHPYKSGL